MKGKALSKRKSYLAPRSSKVNHTPKQPTEAEVVREYFEKQKEEIPPQLICEECEQPIIPGDVPVVLEWGHKDSRLPAFLGRSPKRALHSNCERKRNGKEAVPTRIVKAQPAEPKAKRVRAEGEAAPSRGNDKYAGQRLWKMRPDNPRKEGTHGWTSWEMLKDGMTVEEYLKAGGRRNDLAWDVDRAWVALSPEAPPKPSTGKAPKGSPAPSSPPPAPAKAASPSRRVLEAPRASKKQPVAAPSAAPAKAPEKGKGKGAGKLRQPVLAKPKKATVARKTAQSKGKRK